MLRSYRRIIRRMKSMDIHSEAYKNAKEKADKIINWIEQQEDLTHDILKRRYIEPQLNGITKPPSWDELKSLLSLAESKGIIKTHISVDSGFGAGTAAVVNQLLAKWGYRQNGVAGEGFVKKLIEILK